jgi:hypothetical protein
MVISDNVDVHMKSFILTQIGNLMPGTENSTILSREQLFSLLEETYKQTYRLYQESMIDLYKKSRLSMSNIYINETLERRTERKE